MTDTAVTPSLPTGEALNAKARLLQGTSKTITLPATEKLPAGMKCTLRKIRTGAITGAGKLLAGLAEHQNDLAATERFVMENLREFMPLVADCIVALDGEPATFTADEVGQLESEHFMAIIEALDFGGSASAVAERGFPVDGRAPGVGEGGSYDPHRP